IWNNLVKSVNRSTKRHRFAGVQRLCRGGYFRNRPFSHNRSPRIRPQSCNQLSWNECKLPVFHSWTSSNRHFWGTHFPKVASGQSRPVVRFGAQRTCSRVCSYDSRRYGGNALRSSNHAGEAGSVRYLERYLQRPGRREYMLSQHKFPSVSPSSILPGKLEKSMNPNVFVNAQLIFAAQIGALLTFLNIIPAWQLDGGHIS